MIQEVTMSNNKQSSIEWLFEQIKNHIDAEDGSMGMNWLHDGTFEQAKAMHEEEMKNFTEDWYFYGPLLGEGIDVKNTIEQHFNNTYGGGDK